MQRVQEDLEERLALFRKQCNDLLINNILTLRLTRSIIKV